MSCSVNRRIDLPGCDGAHGVRIHPSGNTAFVACELNNVLARVDLGAASSVTTAPTGTGPDVLSIDADLGWLYVAAGSGDLVVFDIDQPAGAAIDHEHPADRSHSVAVDPATHRVFFALSRGPQDTPVLRVMKPRP
jgi:DNA-binding beta-propeller fold protein YncE